MDYVYRCWKCGKEWTDASKNNWAFTARIDPDTPHMAKSVTIAEHLDCDKEDDADSR